jgi:hypothetical protein
MLPPPSEFAEGRLTPVEFDKDIDEHMRVVAAFANLRARNYSIPEADLHRYVAHADDRSLHGKQYGITYDLMSGVVQEIRCILA